MRERELRRWRLLIHVVVVALLACGASVAAAPKWTQLQSENFLFIGDAAEGQIRRVAERLEQFRDILLRALPGNHAPSRTPTVVMVFDGDRSMAPVTPLFRGRPVEVGGYFQGGADVNYIVVNAEDLDIAVTAIYHEYAHVLVNDRQGEVPVWVNEGLAEFYAATEQPDGGKSVLIGRAPGQHVELLQSSTMMPIKQLITIDQNAAIYNEGSRRSVLYAQSWALVHYLTLGNQARASQFRAFLSTMQAGTPHEDAFAAAFGSDAGLLDRELADYVRQFRFRALRLTFRDESPSSTVPRGKPLDEDEADAYLADVQARIDRIDDARARVAAIQKRAPKVGRAFMVLGAIDLRANRLSEAIGHLEHAAALAPDDFIVQSTYGRSLVSQMSDMRNNPDIAAKLLPQARQALTRAAKIDSGSAQAAYMLGYAELAGGGDPSSAVASLTRAAELDPRRDEYRLLLAQALIRQGEYDRATEVLGRLMAAGRTSETRADARRVMGELTEIKAARGSKPAATLPSPAGPAVPNETRREDNRAGLLLRAVQAGEVRVLGTLDAVDCANGRIVLRVTSDGRTLALRAAQFADIEFISYRSAAPGPVTCGPQQSRDRVYATYRVDSSGAGFDGQAVAVELLPDDFVPPKPR